MHPLTPILFILSLLPTLLLAAPLPLPAQPGLNDAFGQRDEAVPMDTGAKTGNAVPAVAGTGTNILSSVVGALIPRAVAEGVAESVSKVVNQVVKRGMVNNIGHTAGHAVDDVMGEVVKRGMVNHVGHTAEHAVDDVVGEVAKRDAASGSNNVVYTAEHAFNDVVGEVAKRDAASGSGTKNVVDTVENVVAAVPVNTGGHATFDPPAPKKRNAALGSLDSVVSGVVGGVMSSGGGVGEGAGLPI